MKKLEHGGMNFIKWMFRIFLCISFGYFLLGELCLPADSPSNDYDCEEFLSSWVQVMGDGTKKPVDIPGKCEGERGEKITIETILPAHIDRDKYLCFRSSKQDMSFYVDGKLRMEYSTNDTRIFGKTTAVAYVFVEILGDDAGKNFTVETQSDSAYSGIIYSIYYGDKMGVWYNFFKEHGAELLIAFLALLLGVASIIGSNFLKIVYHRQIDLEYLGWSVVISSVWIIANSVFRQIIFPNISTINDMTFVMVMLMPFPFLIYMNEVQKNRYSKVYFTVGLLAVIDYITCALLHVLHVVDFADTIKNMAVVCLLTVATLIITIIIDIKRKCIWQYILVAFGIFGACLAAVIQFANYFARAKEFECSVLAMGLIFLLVISIINTGQGILHMESEKQQAILESAAKARFLANMSHEIRTPINAILGMDEMILRESRDSQIKEYALDIHNAGKGLLSIINEILDLSKIESGKMRIVPVDYDFSSVVYDVINMIRDKARSKGLDVNVIIDRELPARYYGDEVRIRQILLNLLNNAVKYTESGSVTLKISGHICEDDPGIMELEFKVEDTGIGIREEDLSKLFAEFERIDEQRNRNIEGTGLGMSITLTLLHMMDSGLKVESEYGKGSIFCFVLRQPITDRTPIGNLEERVRIQAEEYSYNVSFTAPDAYVLVVDDNDVNRKVFRNLLKMTKVNIDEAASGAECLKKISEQYYDIIFLDHMMPDMDGVETLGRIREMKDSPCENTPVVALTANAISGAKEMYLEFGFDCFLSKPIVPEKLESVIAELLPEDKRIWGGPVSDGNVKNTEKEEDVYDSLPDIKGIDWEFALMHMRDEDTLRQTVEGFYDSIEYEAGNIGDLMEKIQSAFQAGDNSACNKMLDGYRIRVHAMKSSAAMIGAVQLSGVAQLLENIAEDRNVEQLINLTPIFLDEWYDYRNRLECMMPEKHERIELKDKDMAIMYLSMLREAAEDMDIDTLDAAMGELSVYRYSDVIQDKMSELKIAVSNLDEDEIYKLIDDITKLFDKEEL